MDLDFVSVHKHAKKELGQYPVILTSRLVNNPYLNIYSYICKSFVDGRAQVYPIIYIFFTVYSSSVHLQVFINARTQSCPVDYLDYYFCNKKKHAPSYRKI